MFLHSDTSWQASPDTQDRGEPRKNPGRSGLWLLSTIVILLLMQPCLSADIIVPPQAGSNQAPVISSDQKREGVTKAAVAALQGNDLEKARKLLSETPQEEASHPEVQLAALLFELRRPAEARDLLEKFSAIEEHAFESHQLYSELAAREGRWFDALTHIRAAKVCELPKRWNEEKRKAVQFSLQLTEAVCFEGQQQWQAARTVYQAALAERADSPEVKGGLARAAFHLGEPENAAALFREVRVQQKELAPAEILVANLFHSAGNVTEAETWYKKGLESTDIADRSLAGIAYADWLIFHNRPVDTIAALSEKQFDEAKHPERDYLMALAFRMQQKFADAQKLLTTLHQRDAASFPISNQLALVMIESPDESHRARALQIAESNVRNNQNLAEAWSTLGWIQFRLGDVASADKSLSTAMQGGSVAADTLRYLASVRTSQGQPDVAEQLLTAYQRSTGPRYLAEGAGSK